MDVSCDRWPESSGRGRRDTHGQRSERFGSLLLVEGVERRDLIDDRAVFEVLGAPDRSELDPLLLEQRELGQELADREVLEELRVSDQRRPRFTRVSGRVDPLERRGDQRQCLFRVESPHLLRLHIREGDMLPMDSAATAQVLRVFGSKPLPTYALTIELPVYTVGVTVPDTASLAMPVFGADAELLGALTISAPLSRLTPERVEGMKGPLSTAAGELTRALGGFFPDLDQPVSAPAGAMA